MHNSRNFSHFRLGLQTSLQLSFIWLCLISVGVSTSFGQEPATADAPETEVLEYVAPKKYEMQIGVKVTAGDLNMVSAFATTVFPAEWPEQKVEVVEVNFPNPWRHSFRDLPGGNKQLLMQAPMLAARSMNEVTIKLSVEKSHIVGPKTTDQFVVPKQLSRELKNYMGNSPFIEATSSEVRKIVREIEAGEPASDWDKAEKIYDWIRENIKYARGEFNNNRRKLADNLKTVKQTLRDKSGDCEEMTSMFVAMCRAADIPARCVWIPNHCYPEFYLEDAEGNGHWFPCQVAGTRNFGSMPEYLPVLQKGDRFKVPEDSQQLRYINDFLKSTEGYRQGQAKPQVEFVRRLLGDAASLPAPDS